jgi:hypothetical protein
LKTVNQLTEVEIKAGIRALMQGYLNKGYQPEALHTYTNGEGEPLYWRSRLRGSEGKKIFPISWSGEAFELKEPIHDGKKPLYGLAKIMDADTIYLVEGEYKADWLNKIGIATVATTGASSHDSLDFAPLAGKSVYLWPDNDEAGKKHMEAVRSLLDGLGCATHLINIDALELPLKGDAYDYLKAHHVGIFNKPSVEVLKAAKDAVLGLPLATVEAVEGAESGAATAKTEGEKWGAPIPLPELPPVELFDDALMPDRMRPWFVDIAKRMQCPKDFLAVGSLICMGSILGRKVAIRPKMRDDWYEYPNLWGMIIGSPSQLKTPSLSAIMSPIKKIEYEEYQEWQKLHGEWLARSELANIRKAAKKAAAKTALKDGAEVSTADIELEDDPMPLQKRLIVNDTTVEALGMILAGNPNGVLVYRDELIALFKQLEKPGQEDARGFYLTAWSGKEAHISDRVGRGTTRIEACCLSMLGSTQPSVIAEYVRDAVANGGGDGLMARLQLMVFPDTPADWVLVDEYPNKQAKDDAAEVFNRLYALDAALIGAQIDQFSEVQYLRFDDEGFALWAQYLTDLHRRLENPDIANSALGSHLAKYRKLVPALALIFQLVDNPSAGSVGRDATLRALMWSDYLESHANRIYSFVGSGDSRTAKELLQRIKSKRWTEFTLRDVYRNCWSGLDTPETAKSACEVLERYDWIKKFTKENKGRPSESYIVNPSLGADHE